MLDRFKQIAVQIEAQEGVHEAGEASADLLLTKDLAWAPEFERYEREHDVLSLSDSEDLAGRNKAQVTFTLELAGRLDASLVIEAPFGRVLRACGMRQLGDGTGLFGGTGEMGRVFYCTVANAAAWTAGTQLDDGDVVTDGATGTGVVVGTYFSADGGGKIAIRNTGTVTWASTGTITAATPTVTITYTAETLAAFAYVPADKPTYWLNGTQAGTLAAGDIITGSVSGAKGMIVYADGSDNVLVERAPGFGFFATAEDAYVNVGVDELTGLSAPVQFDIPTLSLTFYDDGNRIRFAGARGSINQVSEVGKPTLLEVTLEGNYTSEATAATLALTSALEAKPPIYFGGSMTMDGTFHPLISKFEVDHGREVAMRSDVEQANGWGFASSFARKMSGSLDAEAVQEGIFAFIAKARTAVGVVVESDYGTGGSGNAFMVRAPNCHFNIDPGERDGQRVYTQELMLFHKAATRGDEFLLLQY